MIGPDLYAFATLWRHYRQCRHNKRNTLNALAFEVNAEANLLALQQELRTHTYWPGRAICCVTDGPKPREVFAADFRDRVVHHLLVSHQEYVFESLFIHDSYACRTGKGTLTASDRLMTFRRHGCAPRLPCGCPHFSAPPGPQALTGPRLSAHLSHHPPLRKGGERKNCTMTSRRAFLHQMLQGALGLPAALGLGVMRTPRAEATPASNTFILAQLQYRGGQWDPRPRATIPLMQEVRLRTSVETRDERQVLTLRDAALFSYPFLYMTGERSFEPLSDDELDILRRYLLFGGSLLIDDARGNKGRDFDASVRHEIARLFPERSLKILQPEHTVFRAFYLIRTIGGVRVVNPYLEGVQVEDRTPLIYCQNGLGAAWERDYLGHWVTACQPGGEAQRLEAFKLGVNCVLYALTVNYKQDLIHLPFIRKKMG